MTYKICKVCQTCRVTHFELGKCETCYWDGVALARLERDMGEAERLRKKADEAFDAIKQEFLDFERGEDQ